MTPAEEVYQCLEARYIDLRNIIAGKMKRGVDSEAVDCVAEWAVSKCLRLASKFDPTKGPVWGWVVMVAWGQIQRFYRKTGWKGEGVVVGCKEEGEEGEGVFQRKQGGRGLRDEEEGIVAAIDLKRRGIDGSV